MSFSITQSRSSPNKDDFYLIDLGIIMKKAGQLYLSLVPLNVALASPITVERATQKPTPNLHIKTLKPPFSGMGN